MAEDLERTNLSTLLDDLARDPSRPAFALRTPYRRFLWTAGQTRSAALAFAARLRERGVRPGMPVLLQGPNSPEWVAAFLGIVACGGIVVPLDETSPPDFVSRVARRVGSSVAILAAGACAAPPEGIEAPFVLDTLAEFRWARGPFDPPHRAESGDTAEIVFTSGTTAEPKGVELSHANILVNLQGIERGFRKREWFIAWFLPFRLLCLVPLSHLFGQVIGLVIPIVFRSTSEFSSTLQPTRVLQLIRRARPLAVTSVPRTIAALAEAARREITRRDRMDRFDRALRRAGDSSFLRRVLATRDIRVVTGWRTVVLVSGGAALDPDVEEFWSRCGFFVVQGYGMTEAAPLVAVHNPLDKKRRTIGKRVGSQEVRLSPDGEILVRGPNVMKGYWGDPHATREAVEDGWLHTGDLAEMDAEGRLYFKGRKKDMIVTPDGMNVFPKDVEAVLEKLPGVREAVVFSLPGPRGEEVHAAILPDGGGRIETHQLRGLANERLLPHQRLREVHLWPEPQFPRTSTGKVVSRQVAATVDRLLRLATAAPAEREARLSTRGSRTAAALSRLRPDLAARGEIPSHARLAEDLGLSSLEIVELVSLLEEQTDTAIDDRRLGSSLTLAALDELVAVEGLGVERSPATEAAALSHELHEAPVASPSVPSEGLRVRMPRWGRWAPVRWLRTPIRALLLRSLFRWFVKLEVQGLEHLAPLRRSGEPFLIASNHTSLLDAPAILFSLPGSLRRRFAAAMSTEVLPNLSEDGEAAFTQRLRSGFGFLLAVALFNVYPMPQSRGFRPSLEYTGQLLDAGFTPLVFPEGHMTTTGHPAKFKKGIGLLAVETRCLVVPVRLEGLWELMPPKSRWPGRGRARVIFGAPVSVPSLLRPRDADAVEATRRIEEAVRSLGPREIPHCPDQPH